MKAKFMCLLDEAHPITLGLLLCWQTNKSSSFCSLSAAVSAAVILLGFNSWLDVINSSTAASPVRYGQF